MTVELAQTDFQRLTQILQNQPEFALARDRYRLVSGALAGVERANVILGRIDFDGTAMGTAVELVRLLSSFGHVTPSKEALGAFLEQLLVTTGGGEDADFMSDLIIRYHLNAATSVPAVALPTPPALPADAEFPYLFISYAHADHAIADPVEKYLRDVGFRVFRDVTDIAPGENWDMTIEQALRAADRMVLLLSQTSMPYRKEVHREWFFFDQERKPIYPLFVQQCTLHSRLIAYNYIDARVDLGAALEKLVTEIIG